MVALLVLGLLAAVATVWFVLRPVSATRSPAASEQQHQLQLVRERLLTQLNELDAEAADKGVDAQVANDERRRLEAELATVLSTLDALEAESPTEQVERATRPLNWALLAAASAAVPLFAAVLFVSG
ncbi:MAG: hypothetical protein ACE5LB_16615, partial [Acidiferrobacterales bacterium]